MDPALDGRADVLVVGGGVIGLSVAYALLCRQRSVLVVDAGGPGEATAAAGGMLAPISEVELERPELIELGLDSLGRYPEFVSRLESLTGQGCGFRTEGTLWVALGRDDRAELEHLQESLARRDLAVRMLDSEEIHGMEPHLSGRVDGGLFLAGDQQVDPRRLTRCLRTAVRLLGGGIADGTRVVDIESRGPSEGFVARGHRENGPPVEIETAEVVVAPGANLAPGIRLPGVEIDLRPVKGQLVRLRGSRLLERVVRTPEVYLIPRDDGELLVGATLEEMGHDTSTTAGAVMDLLRHGWEALPGIYDLELVEVSVGLRPAFADHLPVIGATQVPGLYLAVGHFRNGVLLAPATAIHLAEWITTDRPPSALAPFAPRERAAERA